MPERPLHIPQSLFEQLAAGSQVALNEIVLLTEKPLLLRIDKILHNPELSKEIFSDTIYALWVNRRTVTKRSNPVAWIVVTARHKAINKIRDEKRKPTFSLGQFPFLEDPQSPESELEAKENRRLIDLAERNLSHQEKLVYNLIIKQGLSRKEYAERYHVSENTVRNQLHNALKNLRKQLSKLMGSLLV